MDVHYPRNLNLSKQPVSRSIDPVITSIDKRKKACKKIHFDRT